MIESAEPGEQKTGKSRKIERILAEEILSGHFAAHDRFPSERQLMRRFGVARQTVHQVVEKLRQRGLVCAQQGRGTYVSRCGKEARPEVKTAARKKVGVIVSGSHFSEIFPRICKEMRLQAALENIDLIVGDVSNVNVVTIGNRTLELVREMIKAGIAGLILQPLEYGADCREKNSELLAMIREAQVPLVLLDCDIWPPVENPYHDIVGIGNFSAGSILASHLKSRGVKDIRFLIHDCLSESIRERVAGFRQYASGGRFDVVQADPADVEAVREIMEDSRGIDAIVCQNDTAAAKLIASLTALGLRVPEDVRVAGFDDVAIASRLKPSLTTMRQPCKGIAVQAIRSVVRRIENPMAQQMHCRLAAKLVVRESTRAVL